MDDFKKKQIEARLRQMIQAADRPAQPNATIDSPMRGAVQVIRRRQGKPEKAIRSTAA